MDPLLLSRIVVVVHALFLAFVVAGGLLVSRWPGLAWLHLPCALWGALVVGLGGTCPLTPLENRLRAEAGVAGYEGGFIEQYLLVVIYPPGLTRELQVLLALVLALLLAAQYALAWRLHRRRREQD